MEKVSGPLTLVKPLSAATTWGGISDHFSSQSCCSSDMYWGCLVWLGLIKRCILSIWNHTPWFAYRNLMNKDVITSDSFTPLAVTLFFLTSLSVLPCVLGLFFAGLNHLHLKTPFIWLWTDEYLNTLRLLCNPFQLYANQQFLILSLWRFIFCQAWITIADTSYE